MFKCNMPDFMPHNKGQFRFIFQHGQQAHADKNIASGTCKCVYNRTTQDVKMQLHAQLSIVAQEVIGYFI